ncbi:glycoside hydrolase family 3 N-terminal domain-containing protein [Gemmiger sp.]|uniref:glycoside hydrolase family 3 N-terminal domain-containing protein n=1 Tax=Gemmiger sp. TaxID=2049027 RepID=UPI003A945A15
MARGRALVTRISRRVYGARQTATRCNSSHTVMTTCMDIFRAEYGYQGLVMTDWVTPMTGDARSAHRDSQAQYVAAAGGDLFMPGNKGDYDNLLQGIDSGAVTLEQVKTNASRVVRTVRALTQE